MRHILVVAALAALATSRTASATLSLEADSEAADNLGLRLTVRAENEEARDLVPEILFQQQVFAADQLPVLPPGASHVWSVRLADPGQPGSFPAFIHVRYRDAAGHSRMALGVRVVATAGAPPPSVRATLLIDTIAHHGTARLLLDNPQDEVAAGRVVLVLPEELTTTPESQAAEVPASGRTVVPFIVEDAGAAPGTTYPVYALFEYAEDATHQAVVASATAPVVAGAARRQPLGVGLGALGLAIVTLLFALRRSATRRPRDACS